MQKVANGPKEVCPILDLKVSLFLIIRNELQVDVTAWITRCSLELIGRSGLGYSFDSLAENSVPHRYANAAKELLCVFKNSNDKSIMIINPKLLGP